MLRLQRRGSPRRWAERHERLAAAFAGWREETEARLEDGYEWADEEWAELRLAESYHPPARRTPLRASAVLTDVVDACGQADDLVRRWTRLLAHAGQDADAQAVRDCGSDLTRALDEGSPRYSGSC